MTYRLRTVIPLWAKGVAPHLWVDGADVGPLSTDWRTAHLEVADPTAVWVAVSPAAWVNGGIRATHGHRSALSPYVSTIVNCEEVDALVVEYRSAPVLSFLLSGRLWITPGSP